MCKITPEKLDTLSKKANHKKLYKLTIDFIKSEYAENLTKLKNLTNINEKRRSCDQLFDELAKNKNGNKFFYVDTNNELRPILPAFKYLYDKADDIDDFITFFFE